MSPEVLYLGWLYLRALVWVLLIAFALGLFAKNARVTRSFLLAHLVALSFGALTDVGIMHLAPKSWLRIEVLQWVCTLPIAIFTVISLWIGHRESEIVVPDVFMTLLPVVAWGFLVIFGWQSILSMFNCHVLGAWFVSAAGGGIDLFARVGPPWAKRRSYATRLAGYAVVVMAVYLLLPRTELTIALR